MISPDSFIAVFVRVSITEYDLTMSGAPLLLVKEISILSKISVHARDPQDVCFVDELLHAENNTTGNRIEISAFMIFTNRIALYKVGVNFF